MPVKIVVRGKVPEAKIKPWGGQHPKDSHYDFVLDGDVDVVDAKGKPVLALRRGKIPQDMKDEIRPIFKWMKKFKSDNRSKYAGSFTQGKMVKRDGTISKSSRALDENGKRVEVESTVAGFFDRQGGRHPFCRATYITRTEPDKWNKLIPFFELVGKVYKKAVPERYKVQMEYCAKVDDAWSIGNTPFTTITVNNTVAAAYHQDGGDLKDGMGVMVVLKEGEYQGFELVVPEYKAAVNMRDGDIVFFDPTAWHGNIPPFDTYGEKNKDWARISIVLYYREGIQGCLSPDEELARAKNRGAL